MNDKDNKYLSRVLQDWVLEKDDKDFFDVTEDEFNDDDDDIDDNEFSSVMIDDYFEDDTRSEDFFDVIPEEDEEEDVEMEDAYGVGNGRVVFNHWVIIRRE